MNVYLDIDGVLLAENMPHAPGVKEEVGEVLDSTWQWHWRAEREAYNGNAEGANLHADRAVLSKYFYRFNLAQARMHRPTTHNRENEEHEENDTLLREAIVGALTDDEVKKICEKLENGSRFSRNPLAFRKRLQEAFDFTVKRYVNQQTKK